MCLGYVLLSGRLARFRADRVLVALAQETAAFQSSAADLARPQSPLRPLTPTERGRASSSSPLLLDQHPPSVPAPPSPSLRPPLSRQPSAPRGWPDTFVLSPARSLARPARLTRSLSFVEHASPARAVSSSLERALNLSLFLVGKFRGVLLLLLHPLLFLLVVVVLRLFLLRRRYLLLAASSSSPRSSECRASSARSAECHFTFVGLRRVGDRALPGIILSFRALVTSPYARISPGILAAASFATTTITATTTTRTRTIASTATAAITATRFLAVTSRRLVPPPPPRRPPSRPSSPPSPLLLLLPLLPPLSLSLPSLFLFLVLCLPLLPNRHFLPHFLLLLLRLLLPLLLFRFFFFLFFRRLLRLFFCLDEGPFAHGAPQPGE